MSTSSTALELISSAGLSPTEHLLLEYFVEKAVDPDLAAQYLMSRVHRDAGVKLEACLRSFKEDWRTLTSRLATFDQIPTHLDTLVRRRDGPSCCMSKEKWKKGTKKGKPVGVIESAYVIPPSMIRDLASDEAISIWPQSDDNVDVPYVARLTSLLESHSDPQTALQNLWCLLPSIHRAFREGRIVLHNEIAKMAEIGYPIDESSLEKHYNQLRRNCILHAERR